MIAIESCRRATGRPHSRTSLLIVAGPPNLHMCWEKHAKWLLWLTCSKLMRISGVGRGVFFFSFLRLRGAGLGILSSDDAPGQSALDILWGLYARDLHGVGQSCLEDEGKLLEKQRVTERVQLHQHRRAQRCLNGNRQLLRVS